MFPQIHKNLPEGRTISYSWFPAMHSRLDILLCDQQEEEAEYVASLIQQETLRLERIADRFSPDSELFALNQAATGTEIQISPELADILEECRAWHTKTLGCFDITVQSPFRGKSYMDEFDLDKEHGIFLKRTPDLILDLCGYVKGYALDKLRPILHQHGIRNALLNFGNSSVSALGSHPYGQGWKIGMAPPETPGETIYETTLLDQCLTTSGNNKKERKHIISPEKGTLQQGRKQISIVTETGRWGEALSTALFAAPEKRKNILSELPECIHYYEY